MTTETLRSTDGPSGRGYLHEVRGRAARLLHALDQAAGVTAEVPVSLLLRVAALLGNDELVFVDAAVDRVSGHSHFEVVAATHRRLVTATGRMGSGEVLDQVDVHVAALGECRLLMPRTTAARGRWVLADREVRVDGHPGFVLELPGGHRQAVPVGAHEPDGDRVSAAGQLIDRLLAERA